MLKRAIFILMIVWSPKGFSEQEFLIEPNLYSIFKAYKLEDNARKRVSYFSRGFLEDWVGSIMYSSNPKDISWAIDFSKKSLHSADLISTVHEYEVTPNPEGLSLYIGFSNEDSQNMLKIIYDYVEESSGWKIDRITHRVTGEGNQIPETVLDQF